MTTTPTEPASGEGDMIEGAEPDVADVDVADVDVADVDVADVDFATGVSQTGADAPVVAPGGSRAGRIRAVGVRRVARTARPGRLRQRLAGAFVLLIALVSMGGVYSMFAQSSTAQATTGDAAKGRQLFSQTCITCHGANLQGVQGRGPSLLGVGGAATYFQVSTGRMPLAQQGPEAMRKPSIYSQAEIDNLAAYVQSVGGGPDVPTGSLRDDARLAEGGELFRLNCASCHNFAGRGAALSAGKVAPGLSEATDAQIVTAMLSGPENMPVFGDNELTPEQKHEIVSYIQTLKATRDPGGHNLARIGPVSEGLVIWVAGIGALMVVILWIGAKS